LPHPHPAKKPRDLRLDFFRGIGMFIIFIAHMPGNPWTLWIPARFGFSDATEIFVFCSGMASAIAFGAVFIHHGWWMGAARTVFRVWQVYWAHILMFIVIATMIAWFDTLSADDFYSNRLYIRPFLEDPGTGLIHLLTLTYVPNYFDILPMYLVILAMMPFVIGAYMLNRWLAAALVAAMWLAANLGYASLPAEWSSDRAWFFNPFGWQLIFFLGFAFMRGWLKPPPVRADLAALAVAVILLNVAIGSRFGYQNFETIFHLRDAIWPLIEGNAKTDQGLVRTTHFLAIAYLAWIAAGPGGRRLVSDGWWGQVVLVIRRVGQQSLAVFLTSMVLAQALGALLDVTGRTALTVAAANLGGFVVLIATAYIVAFFKRQPWRRPAPGTPAPPASPIAKAGPVLAAGATAAAQARGATGEPGGPDGPGTKARPDRVGALSPAE
jgi:hypothetical protein